jgi:hypothetical protein
VSCRALDRLPALPEVISVRVDGIHGRQERCAAHHHRQRASADRRIQCDATQDGKAIRISLSLLQQNPRSPGCTP